MGTTQENEAYLQSKLETLVGYIKGDKALYSKLSKLNKQSGNELDMLNAISEKDNVHMKEIHSLDFIANYSSVIRAVVERYLEKHKRFK